MHVLLTSPATRAAVLVALSLTTLAANAQGQSLTGAQPGWLIQVGKAGAELSAPPRDVTATFAAPASGFDLASYRGAVQDALPYGLAYDATGAFNVARAGQYKFRITAAWDAADAAKAGSCAASLTLNGTKAIDWQGPVGVEAGQQVVEGSADLQAGPQPAELHVACDKPQGARFRIALALQAPGDSDLRPPGLQDITHGATPVTAAVMPPTAVALAPPQPLVPPPQGQPPAPPPSAEPAVPTQALVATIDLKVRAAPRADAETIRRVRAGESVNVIGPTPDSAWYQLADGGYAMAGFLKPAGAGAVGPERPGSARPGVHHVASRHHYKVGDCAPYKGPADVGGGQGGSVQGMACLQADGRWKIVQ